MRVTDANPTDRLTPWLRPTWIDRPPGFPERATVTDESFESGVVVATAGGVAITRSLLLHSMAFAEFLAGHCFTDDDRQAMLDATMVEFEANPQQVARNLLDVSTAVRRVPELSPIVRARLRHQSVTKIVGLERRLGGAPSPTMACVYRYNPIIAVSDDASTVVTEDAITAWGDLRRLVADVAHHRVEWNEAAFRTEVDTDFVDWTSFQQQSVAEAHPALVATLTGLRQLDDDEREEFADALAEQAADPAALEPTALALGSIGRVTDLVAAVRRSLVGSGA